MIDHVGIIGLGKMGGALAERLLEQGYNVSGWSRSGVQAELVEAGVQPLRGVVEVVGAVEVVFTSLPDDEAVLLIMNEIAGAEPKNKIVVDTSTVTAHTTRVAHALLHQAGAELVDAPIAGGPAVLRKGMVGSMMAGSADAAEVVRLVLEAYSRQVSYFGAPGNGMIAKTVNNSLGHGYVLALIKGLELSEKSGIDRETMLDFLSTSPMASGMMSHFVGNILGRDEVTAFTIDQILGDLEIFIANYKAAGIDTTLQNAFGAYYREASKAGLGDADLSMAIRFAADQAKESQ